MTESPGPERWSGSQNDASVGTPEGNVEVQAPAPRPRKMQSTVEHDGSPTPARRKRRSKRPQGELQRRSSHSETVITAVLGDLQDDIVEGPVGDTEAAGADLPGTPPRGRTNGNKVYVQRVHGFSQSTREKVLCPSAATKDVEEERETVSSPLGTAIAIQKHLLPFYTLCHGLLGGLAVATLIVSYSSGSSADEATRFVVTLSPFVRATRTLFYFLTAICTVSVFDRFDLSNMDCGHVVDVLRYQSMGLLIVAVYLFTLVSTLVCAQWDDGIALYHHNSSHWDSDQELVNELGTWHVLNVCRCVGGVLGWVLIVISPVRDMLRDHLTAMLPYLAGPVP